MCIYLSGGTILIISILRGTKQGIENYLNEPILNKFIYRYFPTVLSVLLFLEQYLLARNNMKWFIVLQFLTLTLILL